MPRTDRSLSESVHVWSDWVDDRAELRELLDDGERARARRFRFERDRVRFVARRVLLRKVLAEYLGVAPAMLRFRTSPFGRPELEPACGITFSTSHSDGLAIVAVASERLVGVDLERVRPITDALDLAQRFFSRREHQHLLSIPETARSDEFLKLWTRKESYVKAVGAGMSMPFDDFDVLDRRTGRALRLRGANVGISFALTSLDGLPGFIGSVAVSGRKVSLRHMTPVAIGS